jgi:hypothetical protein
VNDQLLTASLVRYGAQLEDAIQRDLLDRGRPRRPRRFRRRMFAAPLAGVTAAAVAIIILLSGGPGGASLVDRAYAAIDGNGAVVHFIETSRARPDLGNEVATAQVWIAGKRVRAIITVRGEIAGHIRVKRHEVIVNGDRVTTITDGHARTYPGRECAPLLGFCDGEIGNPLSAIKSLYKSGHLRQAGIQTLRGRKVGVIVGTLHGLSSPITMRIFVDPKTAVPVEIVENAGVIHVVNRGRVARIVTSLISNYRQRPMTPKNEALLKASK